MYLEQLIVFIPIQFHQISISPSLLYIYISFAEIVEVINLRAFLLSYHVQLLENEGNCSESIIFATHPKNPTHWISQDLKLVYAVRQ